ncbi:MAG: DUF4870 domain-containing protein [Lysobacterales bacterium]
MSVPPESATPTPPVASGNTEDRNIAMLTHLSGILFSVLVPLIVWLVHKDNAGKGYLTGEAKEALNFQITVLIGYVISMFLMVILIGALLIWLVWLFNLVFCILAAVKTSSDGGYRYPFTLRLIH